MLRFVVLRRGRGGTSGRARRSVSQVRSCVVSSGLCEEETYQQSCSNRLFAQVEEKLLESHGLIVDANDQMA